MSYRKMNINGTIYYYNIFKTCVKVKTPKGNKIFKYYDILTGEYEGNIPVKPSMVRDLILYGKLETPDNYFSSCSCANKPKSIGILPFEFEVYGKKEYVYYCDDCFDANSWDI